MEKRKATLYDYARMCGNMKNCKDCPFALFPSCYAAEIVERTDECNDIVLKWCDEHPIRTYLQDFTEKLPNCQLQDGIPAVCINYIYNLSIQCSTTNCNDCWNAPMPMKGNDE